MAIDKIFFEIMIADTKAVSERLRAEAIDLDVFLNNEDDYYELPTRYRGKIQEVRYAYAYLLKNLSELEQQSTHHYLKEVKDAKTN